MMMMLMMMMTMVNNWNIYCLITHTYKDTRVHITDVNDNNNNNNNFSFIHNDDNE